MMKAVTAAEFGSPDVLTLTDVPEPSPGANQVLIRVRATSVNPIDGKIRSGLVPPIAPDFPMILQCDVAGVVEAVGAGVSQWQPGDEVFGCAGGIKGHCGALAELMAADADLLARKPAGLTFAQAAGLALVGITAWEAVVDAPEIRPGDPVLVTGGTGGVGHLALQLAHLRGACVTTTAGAADKAAKAAELGAEHVIKYQEEDVVARANAITGDAGFTTVIDTVGGANLAHSFQQVSPGGHVVTINSRTEADLTPLHAKGGRFSAVFMLRPMITGKGRAHHQFILTRLAQLLESGKITLLEAAESRNFSLADAAEAHRLLESRKAMGKITLTV